MRFEEETPRYRAYMLRFWEVHSHRPDRPTTWRFSLQDPQTGRRRGFTDLEHLIAFLRSQTEQEGSS